MTFDLEFNIIKLNFYKFIGGTLLNYYEVLKIDNFSHIKCIKKKFRIRAKQIHPDISDKDISISDKEMRNLLNAYKTLSSPGKKIEYDKKLRKYLAKKKAHVVSMSDVILM